MTIDHSDTYEYLISLEPDEAIEALNALLKSNYAFDSHIIKLATVASQNATYTDLNFTRKQRLNWGDVAVISFHILSKVSPDTLSGNEYSEMNVRARLIMDFGHDKQEQVLDASVLEDWCMSKLEGESLDLIQQVIANGWTQLPIEKIRNLRNLKMCLITCANINDKYSFCDEIKQLIPLRNKLP